MIFNQNDAEGKLAVFRYIAIIWKYSNKPYGRGHLAHIGRQAGRRPYKITGETCAEFSGTLPIKM
jgi:hypothetical protein